MAGRIYLGQGIKYPHDVNQFGAIALENDIPLVRQSIRRILETPVGSVFFNREFGSNVQELLFEPNDNILFSLLDFHIVQAVERWEKRVRALGTTISIDENDPARVNVALSYEILQSNEIDGFVYPFYKALKN